MRALKLLFTAPREVSFDEVELSEPRPGEVLVRTVYSGISSGTELLAYRGDIDRNLPLDETIGSLGGTFSYPFSYGYSCVGVVERSHGSVAPGTTVFAFHPHQERFVVPAAGVLVLPAVDPRAATLFPSVETALQITLDAGAVVDETVAVVGLGVVGLLAALMLQRAGASVVGIETNERRRALASELDVTALDPGDSAHIREMTQGQGVPLVIEASGNPAALAPSLRLLAHEGTALVASWYGTKPVELPLGDEFHRRRLTLRSTQVSTIPAHLTARWTMGRRRDAALRLLGDLPLKTLATHEFPFVSAPDAYRALDRGDADLMHAALAYEDR